MSRSPMAAASGGDAASTAWSPTRTARSAMVEVRTFVLLFVATLAVLMGPPEPRQAAA